MNIIIGGVYYIIGIIYAIYDYQVYEKKNYDKLKAEDNIEWPMFNIYLISLVLLWPLYLLIRLIVKHKFGKF